MNKLSQQVLNYTSNSCNYEIDEILEKLVSEIKEMNGLYIEECAVVDEGNQYIIGLETYTKELFTPLCDPNITMLVPTI